MGRKIKSMVQQVVDCLKEMLCIGESRHIAKQQGETRGIHSYQTYRTYKKECIQFARWARKTYGCKTLNEARPYVDEWLQHMHESGASATTIAMRASAVGKLYGCGKKAFAPTPIRRRADIKRSRGVAERDKHFSEEKNKDFVDFCRGTGLRRREVTMLEGNALSYIDGKPVLHVKGKGGKWRDAPIIGSHTEDIVARVMAAGKGRVWPKVPSNADIHSYRRTYARTMYAMFARDIKKIPGSERYDCRGDLVGTHWDRRAMLIVSRALDHNRIDVIAGHYITD